MTDSKGILIKNIYYMLAYSFEVLGETNYADMEGEDFEDLSDLMAEILARGAERQLKQGLHREYRSRREDIPVLRGRMFFPGVIQNRIARKPVLTCDYRTLSENIPLNRILKTTMLRLMAVKSLARAQRKKLRRALRFFGTVDEIRPADIRWNDFLYHRNNRNYEMLMNICRFILEDLLPTTEEGPRRMADYSEINDQRMAALFQNFVLAYYRRHYAGALSSVGAPLIPWHLDEGDDTALSVLPGMHTDITLEQGRKVLIIDTKFYRNMLAGWTREGLRSAHLYQIFSYVKNWAGNHPEGEVSGLLLYAKTSENLMETFEYSMGGNRIAAATVDLNQPFVNISSRLDAIAETCFGPMDGIDTPAGRAKTGKVCG